MNKNEEPKYGNWVPEKLLVALWSLTVVTLIFLIVNCVVWKELAATIVLAIFFAIVLFYAFYMQLFHHTFSQKGYDLSSKIYDFILEHLDFKEDGKLLDIGCGSGAFTIKAAKKYPKCQAVGLDYWGVKFDYAKEQCENNAKLTGTENVEFIKGDASKLPYEDETFDGIISNFVFHEVDTVKNKRDLVYEALRVLKKGGAFAIHDMFDSTRIYGDINEVVEELKKQGFKEVHYIAKTESQPFVPNSIKLMFNHCGMLYGIK